MDRIKAFIGRNLVLILVAIVAIGIGLGLGRSEGQTMGDWWIDGDEAYVGLQRELIEKMPDEWQDRLAVLLAEWDEAWAGSLPSHVSYMVIPVFDDAAAFADIEPRALNQPDATPEADEEPDPEPAAEPPAWGGWRLRGGN